MLLDALFISSEVGSNYSNRIGLLSSQRSIPPYTPRPSRRSSSPPPFFPSNAGWLLFQSDNSLSRRSPGEDAGTNEPFAWYSGSHGGATWNRTANPCSPWGVVAATAARCQVNTSKAGAQGPFFRRLHAAWPPAEQGRWCHEPPGWRVVHRTADYWPSRGL